MYLKIIERIIRQADVDWSVRHAIGVDVGGTKIEGVLVNEKGRVLRNERILTEADKGRTVVLHKILRVIHSLWEKDVIGIGIGIPGRLDHRGKVVLMPNIPALLGFDLMEYLQKRTQIPIIIENDAGCFALAESMFGAGKKARNMAGIIVGTGVGGGIVLDGRLYVGSRGYAGEIGHAVIEPLGRKRMDVEAHSSGKSIARRYIELGGTIKNPNARKIFYSKEPAARKAVEEAIDLLARDIAAMYTFLDLDIVVLGGGVSNLPLYVALNKRIKVYVYEPLKNKARVVPNELGDSAGVLGAAALVFQRKS
jgi:predicted NBD/HSP70 family sugar kinase